MRNFAALLLMAGLAASWPAIARGHGSSVFDLIDGEHAHEAAHDDHATADGANEIEELHQQIAQLQRRLDEHDRRTRITDVVGAIGYIVGITGAAYYYLGARRRKAAEAK